MSTPASQSASRPRAARDRVKMHLRTLALRSGRFRVVTLRRCERALYSTNYYHDTWHIVTDRHGARRLARLLWGLSYQRRPGTLVLVHGNHLAPTPFDGRRSDAFVLANSDLTRLDQDDLRLLKRRLRKLPPSDRTIRWQTFSMNAALAAESSGEPLPGPARDHDHEVLRRKDRDHLWQAERMTRRGGLICYAAPPAILRRAALNMHRMTPAYAGMDYLYLAERHSRGWWPDGELQIFADYRARVQAAARARSEILADYELPDDPQTVEWIISRRRDEYLRQRRRELRAR